MRTSRWIVAVVMLAALAALLAWQYALERRVTACLAGGGLWNGPHARCDPGPGPTILKRGIERT